jgi:hypothetical protein
MASNAYKEMQAGGGKVEPTDKPKHRQLIRMLSFRVVPAYYKEIEKVANHKKTTVSKLIRTYIKEGMKKDKEITLSQEKNLGVD